MKNYYDEINSALESYESKRPYHTRNIEWICCRIEWCWKWRKISKEEMEELSARAVEILKSM